MQLDRSSRIPLYRQVQDALLAHIHREKLQPGDGVWSENHIARTFGVARSVARQALADLERQGIVERERRGTFLASMTPADHLLSSARGLHEVAAMRGQEVTSRVIASHLEPAPPHIAHQLKIAPGEECFRLKRVRFLQGAPWTFVDSWIPDKLVPNITDHDFRQGSLYALLAETYGLRLTASDRSVEAELAGNEISDLLDVDPAAPVLVLRSIGFDVTNRPIDTFVAWHRADRSRFVVRVSAPNGGGQVVARDASPGV